MKWTVLAAAAFLMGTGLVEANAGDHDHRYCDYHAKAEWKSAREIMDKAHQDGFDVLEIDSKHGCWKIEAIDKSRHRVEVVYDPSGELLWIDND